MLETVNRNSLHKKKDKVRDGRNEFVLVHSDLAPSAFFLKRACFFSFVRE
jgi:hypothetical protein